jgi:NTE family protein
MSDSSPSRVAVACQGGGSHTAFAAGVVQEWLPAIADNYELFGLTGYPACGPW